MFGLTRLELNLKRFNFSASPPAIPVRHFSIDDGNDLPPPIPDRKCSLDSSVNEEFQGRFVFRPLSLVPLPEKFSNCKKLYPCHAQKAPQRPSIQPPPPPPPPPVDYSPSTMMKTGCDLPLPDVTSLPPPLTHLDFQSPHLFLDTSNGPKSPAKNLQPIQEPNDNSDPPPPATRKVPPPPKIKNTSLSTFASSPAAPTTRSAATMSNISPKQNESPQPASLKQRTTQSMSNPDLINNLNQSSSTLPFSPSPPPPPPPLPERPRFPHAVAKPKFPNGSQNRNILKSTPSNNPSVTPPPSLPAHVVMKYKELPQLPVKPSLKNQSPLEAKPLPLLPKNSLDVSKNETNSRLPQSTIEHSQLFKQSSLKTAPLPVVPLSLSFQPQPDLTSSSSHPNKHRPLPSIPVTPLAKKFQPPTNDGWGEAEIYDPRDEEGDIYDVMDSTDM